MDGVAVVIHLLDNDDGLGDLVASGNIQAGDLPQGVALPAISVTSISSVDRNTLAAGQYRHVSERVQVTVLATNYPSQKAILRAVRAAAADKFPTLTGLSRVTVHTEGKGPDMMSAETSVYTGSQDFRVTYSEERNPAAS